jgi:hypothetical protein
VDAHFRIAGVDGVRRAKRNEDRWRRAEPVEECEEREDLKSPNDERRVALESEGVEKEISPSLSLFPYLDLTAG